MQDIAIGLSFVAACVFGLPPALRFLQRATLISTGRDFTAAITGTTEKTRLNR